mgnify:FL=1
MFKQVSEYLWGIETIFSFHQTIYIFLVSEYLWGIETKFIFNRFFILNLYQNTYEELKLQ